MSEEAVPVPPPGYELVDGNFVPIDQRTVHDFATGSGTIHIDPYEQPSGSVNLGARVVPDPSLVVFGDGPEQVAGRDLNILSIGFGMVGTPQASGGAPNISRPGEHGDFRLSFQRLQPTEAPALAATMPYVHVEFMTPTPLEAVAAATREPIDTTTVHTTIDGQPVGAGDRVLLLGQPDPTANGIYVISDPRPWLDRLLEGSRYPYTVFVMGGRTHTGTSFALTRELEPWVPHGPTAE